MRQTKAVSSTDSFWLLSFISVKQDTWSDLFIILSYSVQEHCGWQKCQSIAGHHVYTHSQVAQFSKTNPSLNLFCGGGMKLTNFEENPHRHRENKFRMELETQELWGDNGTCCDDVVVLPDSRSDDLLLSLHRFGLLYRKGLQDDPQPTPFNSESWLLSDLFYCDIHC